MRSCTLKLITYILTIVICADTFTINAYSQEAAEDEVIWPVEPTINGTSSILMDAESGAILYSKKSSKKMYPASITKILTALITLETCPLDDIVTFSHDSIFSLSYGDAHIAIQEDEQLTAKDCLYGLLLASANEVANGLAEHISGTTKDFGTLMTERAKEAGALNSSFTNPSGLHDKNHYTTAYDMAMITKAALEVPDFITISGTTSYTIGTTNLVDESRPVNNKHKMIWPVNDVYYEGMIAGKTGYTKEAGNTLVTCATNGDITLICVVLNSNSGQIYNDTKLLLDYGFDNFNSVDISTSETRTFTNNTNSYNIPKDSTVVLPKGISLTDASPVIETNTSDGSADKDAILSYTYDNHFIGSCSLISSENRALSSIMEPIVTTNSTESYSFVMVLETIFKVLIIILLITAATIGILRFRLHLIRKRRYLQRRRILDERRDRNRRPIL